MSHYGLDEQIDHLRHCGISFEIMSESEARRFLGLRVKMCVWLGVSRGLDLAFLNAD